MGAHAGNIRQRNKRLIEDYMNLQKDSDNSPFNFYKDASDKSLGIVVSGIAWNYLQELYPEGIPFPVVKISQYPIPTQLLNRLFDECKSILVLEEGQPVIEKNFVENSTQLLAKYMAN